MASTNSNFDYDVIFIGSGHACNHAAVTLALAGKKVAFVEKDLIAGTCTNYGCDAKIVLDAPFEYLDGLQNYQNLAVQTSPAVSWTPLMQYKKQLIGAFPVFLTDAFSKLGIQILNGHGKITDKNTVQVEDKNYTAEYIVIGTGARNAVPDIAGKEYLHDSRDFLDLDIMPDRIVFIGAGIISMEFASIALKLGKQVTIIEFSDKALAAYPQEYVKKLTAKMHKEGAEFIFSDAVSEVQKTENGYLVRTKNGTETECDYVLNAVGRIPNIENLGLEELGIQADRKGIVTDDHLRTAVPNIFASGDVLNKTVPKLTPTAAFESDYIAEQILGLSDAPIVYPSVPNLVFTLPRIAQTGITVEEAQAHPDLYQVHSVPYGTQQLWLARNESDIDITFIIAKDGTLKGAAIYGSDAGVWIDMLTLIINQNINGFALKKMIFSFPTSTYGLLSVLIPLMIAPLLPPPPQNAE